MFREQLFQMQDVGYRDFVIKLIPNIDPETIIGIRAPEMRKFVKSAAKTEESGRFMQELPHKYYEENGLHAALIGYISDMDACLAETEKFLPFVDNWAVCDGLRPGIFKKHPEKLLERIRTWIKSEHPYTVRFAVEMLMIHFLDENFSKEYMEMVSQVCSEEYYVNMMLAWYFAEALALRYEDAFPYIKENRLPVWIHNKAVQKAVESRKISDERKAELKGYRRKR